MRPVVVETKYFYLIGVLNLRKLIFISTLILQIKALISAPATEAVGGETKKIPEEPAVADAAENPTVAAKLKPASKAEAAKTAKALGLLGKRTFDKYVHCVSHFCVFCCTHATSLYVCSVSSGLLQAGRQGSSHSSG